MDLFFGQSASNHTSGQTNVATEQMRAVMNLNITTWFKNPREQDPQRILEILKRLPDGHGGRVGTYVYVSHGPDANMERVCVDQIPPDMFLGGVDNLEDFAAAFMQRINNRPCLGPIHGFRIEQRRPGETFTTSFTQNAIGTVTETDKDRFNQFCDDSCVLLGTLDREDQTEPMLTYSNRSILGGRLNHTGDIGNLYHGTTFTDLPPDTLFGKTFTGFQTTELYKFQPQGLMSGAVCMDERVVNSIPCRMDRLSVGDNTHALVTVFMRHGDRILWYVLPIPELASGINTGTRNDTTRAGESRARIAAISAWTRDGLLGNTPQADTPQADTSKPVDTEDITMVNTPEIKNVEVSKFSVVCAVQAGVRIETIVPVTDEGHTLFINYNKQVHLDLTPKNLVFKKGQTLPLAGCSNLMGTPSVIGLCSEPVGGISMTDDQLMQQLENSLYYEMHFTPEGLSDDMISITRHLINGVGILHVPTTTTLTDRLLNPNDLKESNDMINDMRKSLAGKKMSKLQHKQMEAIEKLSKAHNAAINDVIRNTYVTTFTAQLGPCAIGLLEIAGRYFVYRQGVVWKGLFDELYDAGTEVTHLMTREKLTEWIKNGGIKQCGIPVVYRRDSTVFTDYDGKKCMMNTGELLDLVSTFSLKSLIDNISMIRQVLRQLPFVLKGNEIAIIKANLITAVRVVSSSSPEIDSLNEQIRIAFDSGNTDAVKKLHATKRGLARRNERSIYGIIAEVQALSSRSTFTKLANQEKMGIKLIEQLALTKKNLAIVNTMTPDDVCYLFMSELTGVLCQTFDRTNVDHVLRAVEDGSVLKFFRMNKDLGSIAGIFDKAPTVDGLTFNAMSQGAQSDKNHPLAIADVDAQGLTCPVAPSSGHAPSWVPDMMESNNSSVSQSSLVPVPLFNTFLRMDNIMQHWQAIANNTQIQQIRQLMRGVFTKLRKYKIHGASVDLSYFFIVFTLKALSDYCKMSTTPGIEYTIPEEDRKKLLRIGEIEKLLNSSNEKLQTSMAELQGPEGVSDESPAQLESTIFTLETEKESIEKDVYSKSKFFDTTTANKRAMWMLALTYCGAGKKPASFVYQLFSPGNSGFQTPPRDQFFLYPMFVSFLPELGCVTEPAYNNVRHFILGEIFKAFQHYWKPMLDKVAEIDALERKKNEDKTGDTLAVLQRIIPVIFHMAGIEKIMSNHQLLADMATRALSFFPSSSLVKDGKRVGGGSGIVIRFLLSVKKMTIKWEHFPNTAQHILNIWAKRDNFANTHRSKLLQAIVKGNANDCALVTARFQAAAFGKKAKLLGFKSDDVTATDAKPIPQQYSILSNQRVKLLEEISEIKKSGDATPESQTRIKSIDAELSAINDKLPDALVMSGPHDGKPLGDGNLYLIVRGGKDKETLKDKLKQQGVPWSIKTTLQQLRSELRMELKEKVGSQNTEYIQELKKNIAEVIADAKIDQASAMADTQWIITGKRDGDVVKTEQQAVVVYEGPNPEIRNTIINMGDCSGLAVKLCQVINTWTSDDVFTHGKIDLPMDEFINLVSMAGIKTEDMHVFFQRAILTMVKNWRDRTSAMEEAIKLFDENALA